MIIVYNWGTKFKTDKELGESRCDNCGHQVKKILVREIFVLKIFYIPIINKTKRKGMMCSNCGKMEKLNSHDYNTAKISDT